MSLGSAGHTVGDMRTRTGLAAVAAAFAIGLAALTARAALPQQSGSVSLLTQANVQIDGAAAGDEAGWRVAGAGDVNGDGRPDLIIGARFATPHGALSGAAFVVFGQSPATKIDLKNLGTNGFRIDGAAANGEAGYAVTGMGDLNGDGKADVAVSAPFIGVGHTGNGAVYIVFGKSSTSTVDLSALGTGGYEITGAADNDSAGYSLARIGDVNGDGKNDIAIGAVAAGNNSRNLSGSAYVVFGKSSTTTIDLAALGADGYRIDGAAAADELGQSVGRAGDVNGDGVPDVVVGAWDAGNNGRMNSGSAYVVFGKSSTTNIDTASLGSAGYRVDGAAAGDRIGASAGGGADVNGDGRPDVILGANGASENGRTNSGAAYVVFGKGSTTGIDLATLGSGGFRIDGATAGDFAGDSVADAGDVNGDGRPDVIIGATSAGASPTSSPGAAYVVFGRGATTPVDLAALGPAGIRIMGAADADGTGNGVAGAGDFNGDGHPDVVIGAPDASNNGRTDSGSAYVIYGFAPSPTGPGGTTPDRTPPSVSGFAVSPSVFAVGRGRTPVVARTIKRGTRFRFKLSEPATTTITIKRGLPGRRVGKRCRKPSAKLRQHRACTRLKTSGKLTRRNQPAGTDTVKFSGRIGRRALAPGSYRATITATDAAGNKSKPRTARFRIVKG